MRLIVPALAILLLAGCSAPEPAPMPVPSQTPSVTPSPTVKPPTMLPMPGTGFMLDQLDTYGDDTRAPVIRFSAAHVGGEGENFTFDLAEGSYVLRVSCATDASDSVDVTLEFADGREGFTYPAYCGETPPSGIVTATTQGAPFAAGGSVTMRLESGSRFVAAAGLVPEG